MYIFAITFQTKRNAKDVRLGRIILTKYAWNESCLLRLLYNNVKHRSGIPTSLITVS